MAALFTGQINYLRSRILHDTGTRWLGTFARDQIPPLEHEKRPFALVVNSDVAAEMGEHWLALYSPGGTTKIELFDSFGLPPNIYSFDQSSFQYFIRSIQEFSTKVCGHYALLFIYFRSRGNSFDRTINLLDRNFTDASAARKMLDLSLSELSHVHCTGQNCKIKK